MVGWCRGEWKKYWSVLRYGSLALYRDHAAEDAAMSEDVIDLAQVVGVDETDSGRSYGFLITTTDGRRQSMAALTAGIRSQWIQALRNACNQAATTTTTVSITKPSLRAEKENLVGKDEDANEQYDESLESYSTGTVSSSENDEDENNDDLDSVDSDSPLADTSLPPSPPVNRTAISLVKERHRSRSSSRHRSGSPSNSSVHTNSPPPSLPPPPPPIVTGSVGDNDSTVKLDAAKTEIARLLAERRDQERDAKKQVTTLGQRLAEKERQIASLSSKLDAIKAESQRQLNDIRFVIFLNIFLLWCFMFFPIWFSRSFYLMRSAPLKVNEIFPNLRPHSHFLASLCVRVCVFRRTTKANLVLAIKKSIKRR